MADGWLRRRRLRSVQRDPRSAAPTARPRVRLVSDAVELGRTTAEAAGRHTSERHLSVVATIGPRRRTRSAFCRLMRLRAKSRGCDRTQLGRRRMKRGPAHGTRTARASRTTQRASIRTSFAALATSVERHESSSRRTCIASIRDQAARRASATQIAGAKYHGRMKRSTPVVDNVCLARTARRVHRSAGPSTPRGTFRLVTPPSSAVRLGRLRTALACNALHAARCSGLQHSARHVRHPIRARPARALSARRPRHEAPSAAVQDVTWVLLARHRGGTTRRARRDCGERQGSQSAPAQSLELTSPAAQRNDVGRGFESAPSYLSIATYMCPNHRRKRG